MDSLLEELSKFSHGLSTAAQQEIAYLNAELSAANGRLQALNATLEQPTMQAKLWMRQVREMVYDIEDWIDELKGQTDREAHNHARGIKGLVWKLNKMGSSSEILSNIRHFAARVNAANSRHKRYDLGSTSSSGGGSGSVAVLRNPPSSLPYVGSLVGVDRPKKELLDLLGGEGKRVKVISVVGSGGIGKTSLARLVYGKLQLQFECRAFVYVGQSPSVTAVLKNMLYQVNRRQIHVSDSWDEQQLIQKIKDFLSDKKYFVVLNDVWSLRVYQVLRGALPDNNAGSRIMLTTCSYDLVRSSSILHGNQVFEVKPLSSDDSRTLLLGTIGRIFGPGMNCPTHLAEACNIVLERCGGMPLAIVVLAGVLSNPWGEGRQQQLVERYILSDEYFGTENMREILHICYMTLHHDLKSCFLYLSVFPEKYVIPKGRLIRRWIAEGFISGRGEMSSFEIGENYLNDLVIRSLIQPLSFDENEQEECYTVHYMIHQFIISLSIEANFVTVPGKWIQPNMIRRLSIQSKNQDAAPAMPSVTVLSHIRSMTIFGYNQLMQDLSLFHYLRVLDLEDADNLENSHLKNIGKLFQLKYLGLGGEDINKLPEQIGDLQYMQTLHVTRTNINELPARVLQLKMLHLHVSNVEVPEGVGRMKELEELSLINITKDSAPQSIEELGELKKLKILGVKWCIDDKYSRITTIREHFVNALKVLGESNLQSLTLHTIAGSSLDFLVDRWPSTLKLKKFKLLSFSYCFKEISQGMATSLAGLTHIEIGITNTRYALEILGGLPALVLLKLRSGAFSSEERLVINKDMFKCVKELWFMRVDGRIARLLFEKEAMPKLQMLVLQYTIWGAQSFHDDFPLGTNHLLQLKHVHFKMDCEGAGVSEVKAAKDALQMAIHGKMGSEGAGLPDIEPAEDAIGGAIDIHPTYEFELITHREDKSIQGIFKCNSHGVGTVIRSSSGFFVAAMARSLKVSSDDKIRAAAWACQEAMEFALEAGFKRINFTTDSKQLVNMVESEEAQRPTYAKTIEEIKKLKDLFESVSLKHHPDTVEADKVANHASDNQHQLWTIKHPPEFLSFT
ncbi:unnamed protein product [Urochloa decumbens]|uniref:Uncharacterized protein n=1 Tax=Urochloa decumbens TaxID=240449 RepID=A0ABC9AQD5_9POAL